LRGDGASVWRLRVCAKWNGKEQNAQRSKRGNQAETDGKGFGKQFFRHGFFSLCLGIKNR
jgi:hypothetical protein